MTFVIASSRNWSPVLTTNVRNRSGHDVVLIQEASELTLSSLREVKPALIFFPHWSTVIPDEIFNEFECVIFHMTDVPFGRGGSPLQNLISRGIYETKISAIRCCKEIDAGPVYQKRDLSLNGSAQEIYVRASRIIEDMIVDIAVERPEPVPQSGSVTVFKRRTREDGNLAPLNTLEQVHDFIRMLDADGYPSAYLETEHMVFEFSRSSFRGNSVVADVRIRRKNDAEQ